MSFEILEQLLVDPDPTKYKFIRQGMLKIDNVNDADEMKKTKEAFDMLGFSSCQQIDLFKVVVACAIFGNNEWKNRAKDAKVELDADFKNELETVARLLGVDQPDLIKSLTNPKVKVGNEYVNVEQSVAQVTAAIEALSRALYMRCFNWLAAKVNEVLEGNKQLKKTYFTGILDISGFVSLDVNKRLKFHSVLIFPVAC